jgi:transposase
MMVPTQTKWTPMTETTSRRTHHSKDLKAEVLAECERPGACIASVAMAHGINANLVHKWRARAMKQQTAAAETGSAAFIPVPLPTTGMTPVAAELRIEVRRGAMTATVCWPMSATAECGAWLREVLR